MKIINDEVLRLRMEAFLQGEQGAKDWWSANYFTAFSNRLAREYQLDSPLHQATLNLLLQRFWKKLRVLEAENKLHFETPFLREVAQESVEELLVFYQFENRELWEKEYREYREKIQTLAKAKLGLAGRLSDTELLSLFIWTHKKWKGEALAKSKSRWTWLLHHPEKDLLRDLHQHPHPPWQHVQDEFMIYSKGKFTLDICAKAVAIFRKKMHLPEFRIWCRINTYLNAIAKRIDPFKPPLPLESPGPAPTEGAGGTNPIALKELEAAIFFQNLMIRRTDPTQEKKIDCLLMLYQEKKSYQQTWEKIGLGASPGALRVQIHALKNHLKVEQQKIARALRLRINYRQYQSEKGKILLGVTAYHWSDLQAFFEIIGAVLQGRITVLGRFVEGRCSQLTQLGLQQKWKTILICDDLRKAQFQQTQEKEQAQKKEEKLPLARAALTADITDAAQLTLQNFLPFSLLLLDETLKPHPGYENDSTTLSDFELLTKAMHEH